MSSPHSSGFFIRAVALLAALSSVAAAEDPYEEGEVLVTFRENVTTPAARTSLAKRSLALTEHYDRISERRRCVSGMVRDKSRTTAKLIEELRKDPDVETAEPNYYRHTRLTAPNDTRFGELWGLRNTGQTVNATAGTSGVDVKFLEAWNLSRASGQEIVVGVIDTGVDITHPDLVGNIWTNPGEIAGNGIDDDANGYIDDVHGYDFRLGTASMTDSGEHGTHVSGTIAASGKNALGVIGLQYKAKILPLKVSSDGSLMLASAVVSACNYAVALKAKGVNIVAINASFGGGSFSTAERNAISALNSAGIVFCAAAGNEGADNDATTDYPSGYNLPNIISVAAITSANTLASYSNYGATTVDIGAPGSSILSTVPLSQAARTDSVTIGSTVYAARHLEFSGTTIAAGITRSIHSCGTGETASAFPAAVSGNIALIQRGNNTFAEKVTFATAAGAVAAIIYDNTTASLASGGWTLGSSGSWIPVLQVTQATGNAIIASLPASGTVTSHPDASNAYGFLSGTSMATPHVAAAVALAAWNFPSETVTQRISRILSHTTAVSALSGKTVTGGRLDLLKMIDTDSDGLPDWWETEYFGSLAKTAAEDTDGDGFSNLAEFIGGTVPTSGASYLAFASAARIAGTSGANFALTFPTVAERFYRIEWSEGLDSSPWTQLGGTITGTGSPVEVIDIVTGVPQRFYRLRLLDP